MNWKGGKTLKKLYKKNANFELKNNAGRASKNIIPEKIWSQLQDQL